MADVLSRQALSDLIGSIYDCTLEPDRWEQTLAKIRSAFDSETTNLFLYDTRSGRLLIHRGVGMEPYLELGARHFSEINLLMVDHLSSIASLDEPFIFSRHVPQHVAESSDYLQRLIELGFADAIQYHLVKTHARISDIAFGRNRRQGLITDREIEIGGLLLPHIRRAVTISNVLDAATIERERIADALDALRCAVMLTDARGTILHANRSAEEMLRDGGPVYGRGGMLHARTAIAAEELRSAIRLAAQDEAIIGKAGLSVMLTDGPPLFAHVLPLTGGDLRTRLQPAAVAAVFIGAPPDTHDGAELMAVAYGLTPAETRVLASLLAGRTLAETATALGIAGSTANTHLDNIFSKSGVSRHADLIRLGAQMVPPIQATA